MYTVAKGFALVCVCVCVCVCVRACVRACVRVCNQEFFLTLLQSTKLCNGDLLAWCQQGKQPTRCNINGYLSVCVSHNGLWVPTLSPVRHSTASCISLVLPQENLPALTLSTWVAHKCPSAGSLGRRDCVSTVSVGFACFVYV